MMASQDKELQILRSTVRQLMDDHNRFNNQLIGVQVITDQLDQKTEECRVLKSKLKQLEVLLSRAENRIAQLTLHLNDKGSTTPKAGIVTPGVSKKLLETITKENTKLKMALEHVLNKLPKGIDLAVENQDLHDLVMVLKQELEQNRKETEELRSALKAVETDDLMALQDQIAQLTAELTHTERSLKAKQVYCESILNENERLRSTVETQKTGQITQLATLRKLANEHPAIKDVLEFTWSEDDVDAGQNQDIEKLTKEISSLQKDIADLKEANAQLSQQKEQVTNLLTREIQELKSQNVISREEIEKMTHDLQEVNMVKELLQGQCQDFENDFKMERQEKARLESELKRERIHNQDLAQSNKQIKEESEKIKQLIKEEYERKQKQQISPPTTSSSPQHQTEPRWKLPQPPGYKPHHFNPRMPQVVVADSPSGQRGHGMSYLECPICKMILPPHEIEGHLNDCDGK